MFCWLDSDSCLLSAAQVASSDSLSANLAPHWLLYILPTWQTVASRWALCKTQWCRLTGMKCTLVSIVSLLKWWPQWIDVAFLGILCSIMHWNSTVLYVLFGNTGIIFLPFLFDWWFKLTLLSIHSLHISVKCRLCSLYPLFLFHADSVRALNSSYLNTQEKINRTSFMIVSILDGMRESLCSYSLKGTTRKRTARKRALNK